MKARLRPVCAMLGGFALLALGACATGPGGRHGLPPPVAFDEATGRGQLLILTLRLESGEPLPFLFDTGTAISCIDQSLEPRLGRRLGPATVLHFGVKHEGSLYPAPRLYLGETLLKSSGAHIATFDFRRTAPDGVLRFLGILGMDVLGNYCMQLDFDAHQLRFLKSRPKAPASWGKGFPLVAAEDGCPTLRDNLLGTTNPVSIVDTGFNYDGWLTAECFRQWTHQPPRWDFGEKSLYYGLLGGETYTSLNLREIDPRSAAVEDPHLKLNGIGLRFLARHRVTFDFPRHTMYLQRTSVGPRVADPVKTAGEAAGRSAFEYVLRLKDLGQLAGWSRADDLADGNYSFNVTFLTYPNSDLEPQAPADLEQQTIVNLYKIRKRGDPSLYLYELRRARSTDSWRMEKAWRTDPDGRILEQLLP